MPAPVTRQILPTAKSAAEIRADYDLAVRQRSFFSARTTQARYLQEVAELLEKLSAGEENESVVRLALQRKLAALGYDPEAGGFPGDEGIPPAKPGSLTDLSSDTRLRLVLRTNQSLGTNLARKAEAAADPDALWQFPGWEFARLGHVEEPRDWTLRWQNAGGAVGWEGASRVAMVALKSSPIWAALGEYGEDSTGSDVPPFAYNSQMGWLDADRGTCVRLGLIAEDEAAGLDYEPSLGEREIADALDGLGSEFTDALLAELEESA